MANKINKVVFGDEVLIDLTDASLSNIEQDAKKIAKGEKVYGKDGELITGTSTLDSDTTDATATKHEILSGKTAYVGGEKITGDMPNIGAVSGVITDIDTAYKVPMGFHDGSGTVGIDATEKIKIIPDNIREGVTILGVEGTMSGSEDERPQDNKTATPKKDEQQVILPDADFTCLRQVTVEPIPYTQTPNSAGGITATIAGV